MPGSIESRTSAKEINDDIAGRPTRAVFKCPNNLCDEQYKSFSALEKHQLSRACAAKRKNNESGMAYITRKYIGYFSASKTEDLTRHDRRSLFTNFEKVRVAIPSEEITRDESEAFFHTFEKGFALKRRKAGTVYNENQKSYLKKLFMFGEKSKKKYSHSEVAVMMRKETLSESSSKLRFTEQEWLDEYQIKYQFAKMAAQLKKENDVDTDGVIEASAVHEELENIDANERRQIVEDLALEMEAQQTTGYGGNTEQTHPWIINNFNICEIASDYIRKRGNNGAHIFSMSREDLRKTLEKCTDSKWRGKQSDAGEAFVDFVSKKCFCLTLTE